MRTMQREFKLVSLERTPDSVECTPDSVECTPDSLECTPDSVECWLRARVSNMLVLIKQILKSFLFRILFQK